MAEWSLVPVEVPNRPKSGMALCLGMQHALSRSVLAVVLQSAVAAENAARGDESTHGAPSTTAPPHTCAVLWASRLPQVQSSDRQ